MEQLETPVPPAWPVIIEQPTRRGFVLETWCVQIAFLVPGVTGALVLLIRHIEGVRTSLFQVSLTAHPGIDLLIGIVSYLAVGAVVPVTLLLLSRTGQRPADIGLLGPAVGRDIWPGIGLTALGFVGSFAAGIILLPLISHDKGLFNQLTYTHIPTYYIAYGIVVAAVTAITEECLVNGYLLIRLDQLGWSPRRALVLSLTLRASYHIYYGLGFLAIIPSGYFFTRSFQKHRRLARPIIGHFLYDTLVFTVTVLSHR